MERRTLYRHFPSEAELFEACSTHYFAAHPFPDPAGWRDLAQALDELYAYYEETAPMLANVLRDAELAEFARDAVAPLHTYLDQAADVLLNGRRGRLLAAAIRHALAFSTWRSLNSVKRSDAVKLVTALVERAG